MSIQPSYFPAQSHPYAAPLVVAAALFSGLLIAPAMLAAQQPDQAPYHIVEQWKIGVEGGWDYLTADPAAHRLYLAHGPRVDVVDTTTGKVAGSITGLHGTHGIALAKH